MDAESPQQSLARSDADIESFKERLARLEELKVKSTAKREEQGSSNTITAMFLLVLGGLLIAVGYLVSPQTHIQMISEALKVIGSGVSVFAVTSYLQTKWASDAAQLQLEEAKSEIQGLSEQVREAITDKLENTRGAIEKLTEKNLNDIRERITEVQNFEIIRERPDVSNLNKVIFKYVSDWIEKIRLARLEKRIILEEDYVALFPYVFKRTLELYPDASFVATSLARESYLWKYQFLVTAIRKFMTQGGQMQRIFLLDTPFDEPISKEEASVIKTNLDDLQVTVYVANPVCRFSVG